MSACWCCSYSVLPRNSSTALSGIPQCSRTNGLTGGGQAIYPGAELGGGGGVCRSGIMCQQRARVYSTSDAAIISICFSRCCGHKKPSIV